MRFRRPRVQSKKHLAWIRTLPCLLCGNQIETEATHVRHADSRYDKRQTGKGEKPDDIFVVPLCGRHHKEQHNFGDERLWWYANCRDPVKAALDLWEHSGNIEAVPEIFRACKIR